MPGSTGPNLGLVWGYSIGEDGWGVGSYNPGFAKMDTLIHLSVIDIEDTPPGAPVDGDRYIVGGSPTGDFSGHEDEIAVRLAIGGPAWVFYAPKTGWRLWNEATSTYFRFDGAWIEEVFLPPVVCEAHTTNYSVLVGDNETIFTNEGAVAAVNFSLPAAVQDIGFGFLVDAAQTLTVTVQAGEIIRVGADASSAGGTWFSNLPGSFMRIRCNKAGQWFAESQLGAWDKT